MSYPAISLATATVGRHRCPQKRLQTAPQPPGYPNSSPDHRACNSLTPFRCPHAVHPCPSVDSGLEPIGFVEHLPHGRVLQHWYRPAGPTPGRVSGSFGSCPERSTSVRAVRHTYGECVPMYGDLSESPSINSGQTLSNHRRESNRLLQSQIIETPCGGSAQGCARWAAMR